MRIFTQSFCCSVKVMVLRTTDMDLPSAPIFILRTYSMECWKTQPSAMADTARACLSLSSRLTRAFFGHPRQGPKSVQNLFELGLSLLERRVFAIDIMRFHLEGHCRHSAVRAGLGNQVIALRGLPVGVFGVASLETGTDQAAGLIAEGDIPRAEAINLQQAGISVWYQTPHGHAEKLTGRWLINPIEQCRSAARTPLVPEVERSEERRVGKECESRWATGDE